MGWSVDFGPSPAASQNHNHSIHQNRPKIRMGIGAGRWKSPRAAPPHTRSIYIHIHVPPHTIRKAHLALLPLLLTLPPCLLQHKPNHTHEPHPRTKNYAPRTQVYQASCSQRHALAAGTRALIGWAVGWYRRTSVSTGRGLKLGWGGERRPALLRDNA